MELNTIFLSLKNKLIKYNNKQGGYNRIRNNINDVDIIHINNYKNNLDELKEKFNIKYTSIKCNYGGFRYYLVCPVCNKKYTWLAYSFGEIACRNCNKINYISSTISKKNHKILKLNKLLKEINANINIYIWIRELLNKPNGFNSVKWSTWYFIVLKSKLKEIKKIKKPKNMNNKTFSIIIKKIKSLVIEILYIYLKNFKWKYKKFDKSKDDIFIEGQNILDEIEKKNTIHDSNNPFNFDEYSYYNIRAD